MLLDPRLRLFVCLAGLFITSLVVGDIIGGKLVSMELGSTAWMISVGMIPFPVVFLLTDLINEFYGKRAAQFVTLVGFAMASFTIVLLLVSVSLPWAPVTREPGWKGVTQGAFDRVFASSRRILVASVCAYLIAQLVDIGVFHRVRHLTRGRFLWMRATGSTLVSQAIDSVVVQYLAWTGVLPLGEIFRICITSYAVKAVVAIGITPLLYLGHEIVERYLGIEPVPLEADT